MYNQILAIDIVPRVPDFLPRVTEFTKLPPLCFSSLAEALASGVALKAVDALVISIHQSASSEELKQLPELHFIGVLGSSTKKLPLEFCAQQQIRVANVTEYCDEDTAEWVMLKALEYFRSRATPMSATHKSLGLIGTGAVAQQVINMASGFHMNIGINSRTHRPALVARGIKELSKEELFAWADIVSVHTPPFLQWLSKDILRNAKQNLCIINTCMGRISVGNDLEDVLSERPDITIIMDKIAGDAYPSLAGRATICTDAAFATDDARKRLVDKFFANLCEEV